MSMLTQKRTFAISSRFFSANTNTILDSPSSRLSLYTIKNLHHQILLIIAELFAEQVHAALEDRILLHTQPQIHMVLAGELQLLQINSG